MSEVNATTRIEGNRVPQNTLKAVTEQSQKSDTVKEIFTLGTNIAGAVAKGVTGSGALGSIAGLGGDPFSSLQKLLQTQTEVQARTQEFSLKSNVANADHRAKMTAVNNASAR